MQQFRQHLRAYYFRKLTRYLDPGDYRRVEVLRNRTGPQLTIPELLYLRWAVRTFTPEVLVEIGSFNGASTSVMADQLQRIGRGRVYAIDLFSKSPSTGGYGSDYWNVFDQTMQPYRMWCEKIEGDSKTIPWTRPIDLLFIDGDHSEGGVLADLAKYAPLVRAGGGVFLHDYLDSPETNSMVRRAVDRTLLRNHDFRLIGRVGSLIGFRKSM